MTDHNDAIDTSDLDDPTALAEDAAAQAQYDLIRAQHGEQAAEAANYGWGVGGDDCYVSYATKVYGHGVLITEVVVATGEMTHEWR